MANVNISIPSNKLDVICGIMTGFALADPKHTDQKINDALKNSGFNDLEIMIARTELGQRLEAAKAPIEPAKPRGKRKPKDAEVAKTVEA